MRKYEGLFIFHPQIQEDILKKKVEEIEKYVASQKGKLEKTKEGVRGTLPYPIKKCVEGITVIFNFEMSPDAVDQLKKQFLKDENILRYTIIKK